MLLSLLATLALAPTPASAVLGPPAICFPLDIGDAASLPWGGGWRETDTRYDVGRLHLDVAGFLDGTDDVLVHMETIRRAALYIDRTEKKQRSARLGELKKMLEGRVADAKAVEPPDPVRLARARFDLGYAFEALRQCGHRAGDGRPALDAAVAVLDDDGAVRLAMFLALGDRGDTRSASWGHLDKAVDLAETPKSGRLSANCLATAGRVLGAKTHDELRAAVRRQRD